MYAISYRRRSIFMCLDALSESSQIRRGLSPWTTGRNNGRRVLESFVLCQRKLGSVWRHVRSRTGTVLQLESVEPSGVLVSFSSSPNLCEAFIVWVLLLIV